MADTRVWRYRANGEKKIFASPDAVPKGEGWEDSPAKVEATEDETRKEHSKDIADMKRDIDLAVKIQQTARRGRPPKAK